MAVFLRHPRNFRAAVLEAVNAGGDTDSTASMVGALVGANCGLDVIPAEWLNFRPEFQEPVELGEKLYRIAEKRM
jgi:ADP-ribosylglycohydrolase